MKKYKLSLSKPSFTQMGKEYSKAITHWLQLGGTQNIATEFILTYSIQTGNFKLIKLKTQ